MSIWRKRFVLPLFTSFLESHHLSLHFSLLFTNLTGTEKVKPCLWFNLTECTVNLRGYKKWRQYAVMCRLKIRIWPKYIIVEKKKLEVFNNKIFITHSSIYSFAQIMKCFISLYLPEDKDINISWNQFFVSSELPQPCRNLEFGQKLFFVIRSSPKWFFTWDTLF